MATPGFENWLRTRPPCVRALAAEFPLGIEISVSGETHYVIGYTEDDQLIISPVDPSEDYDGALVAKVYVCAEHLRSAAN